MNNMEKEFIHKVVMGKLSEDMRKEWNNYNKFLNEEGISVLPNAFYKDGKKMNYKEVRLAYDAHNLKNK